jgi:hypothetical protein
MARNENLPVHHKVKDYATWRTSYDSNEKSRLSAGITNGRVFRSPEDRNDVEVLQDCVRRGKGPYRNGFRSSEAGNAKERRHRLTQHSLRGVSIRKTSGTVSDVTVWSDRCSEDGSLGLSRLRRDGRGISPAFIDSRQFRRYSASALASPGNS